MLSGGPSSALGPGFPARLPPFVSCGRFSFVRTPFFLPAPCVIFAPRRPCDPPRTGNYFYICANKTEYESLIYRSFGVIVVPFVPSAEWRYRFVPAQCREPDERASRGCVEHHPAYRPAQDLLVGLRGPLCAALFAGAGQELRGCDQRFADGCRRELLRPSRHEARTGDGPLLSGPGLLQRREFRCRHPFLLPCRGCRFRHRRLLSVGIDQQRYR